MNEPVEMLCLGLCGIEKAEDRLVNDPRKAESSRSGKKRS